LSLGCPIPMRRQEKWSSMPGGEPTAGPASIPHQLAEQRTLRAQS